jgi:acetamidase/formamidase
VVGDGIVHAHALDAATTTGHNQHGHTIALRPFLGVMGMPPAATGRHSTMAPRACGGNLDCRELVSGSTLYLPIEVDGALLSTGDGHAAQADGVASVGSVRGVENSRAATFARGRDRRRSTLFGR